MAQPSTDRLALLYRLSDTFNSSLDLDQVLNLVIDEVIAVTRAERGFLMLYDEAMQLVFRAARGMDQQTIDTPEFQVSRGVVDRVAREQQPVLTSNAQSDEWLSGRASIIGLGLRSILCVPLLLKGRCLGVIYVDNRLQAGLFTPDDLELLTSIASSAAIALDNARLYQVALEKGRMERELQMARQVQASLLPRETPLIPGWQVAAWWQPARQVSGDFYDFLVDGPDRIAVVIGDVADKGMPAALFMTLTRSTIRATLAQHCEPAECIAQVNRLLCDDADNGMFVTVLYGELNPVTSELVYVCAGHYPPLWYRAAEDRLTGLESTGMALAVHPWGPFEQRRVQVSPGDMLVFYTDGVIDATNERIEEFGHDRLHQVLFDHRRESADDIVGALQSAIHAHVGPTVPFDDIAVVLLKRVE